MHFSFKQGSYGKEDDFQVQEEGPFLKILHVIVYALRGEVVAGDRAPGAVNLCEAGNTGANLVTAHGAVKFFAVLIHHGNSMGPRPYDGHFSLKDVEELG